MHRDIGGDVHPLAVVAPRERGQTIAEAALVLPALLVLVLGCLQCVILAYGAATARFAAFCAVRSCAVAPELTRQSSAASSVSRVLGKVPAVTPVSVLVRETPLPLRGAGLAARRMTCTVVARVPRVLPVLFPGMTTVRASCALPMEPVL